MKITHYPGKAVDASLSLDNNSAMGALYEANWLQAHHQHHRAPTQSTLSRQPSNAGSSSFLLDGISALSKYQMTLENIRQLEQQAQDKRIVSAIKELNGYRPSAVQHHQQQQLHNGWVAEEEEQLEEPLEDKAKTDNAPTPAAASVNHYVLDPTERQRLPRPRQQVSVKPPSLRRSQTMLQHQPPSYVTLRAPKSKPAQHNSSNTSSAYSTFSSAAEDRQPERVICQQPLRLLQPPTEPPPAPPAGSKARAFKPLSRSQTSVQRYATIRMPNHSTSFCRATARAAETPDVRRHSLEQALQGLQLEEVAQDAVEQVVIRQPGKQSRHISPVASSNGSSKDLNGEGFCIPRPRLIVPVHTYARRRRTGNLKEQSTNAQDEDVASGKKC